MCWLLCRKNLHLSEERIIYLKELSKKEAIYERLASALGMLCMHTHTHTLTALFSVLPGLPWKRGSWTGVVVVVILVPFVCWFCSCFFCWSHVMPPPVEWILSEALFSSWPVVYVHITAIIQVGSVAEWLACWTRCRRARVQIAAATLSGYASCSHPLCLCSPSSKTGSSPLKGCGGNCRPGGK